MNQKKAKALRQSLRSQGINPTQAAYEETIPAKPRQGGVNPDGTPWYFTPPGTQELSPTCGKYRYRVAKKASLAT